MVECLPCTNPWTQASESHDCNLSIQRVEARGSDVLGHSPLHRVKGSNRSLSMANMALASLALPPLPYKP